jgi:hypothetical protein
LIAETYELIIQGDRMGQTRGQVIALPNSVNTSTPPATPPTLTQWPLASRPVNAMPARPPDLMQQRLDSLSRDASTRRLEIEPRPEEVIEQGEDGGSRMNS